MVEAFRTERLIAERLRENYFDELCRMHRDRGVMATLAPAGVKDGGVLSDEETLQFLRRHLAHWERHGHGLWVFRDRVDNRFVARAGLYNTLVGGNDEVELAYALVAEYWNRGLATEMARAILAVAFEQLGMTNLVCFTLTTNRASQRVMQKPGSSTSARSYTRDRRTCSTESPLLDGESGGDRLCQLLESGDE